MKRGSGLLNKQTHFTAASSSEEQPALCSGRDCRWLMRHRARRQHPCTIQAWSSLREGKSYKKRWRWKNFFALSQTIKGFFFSPSFHNACTHWTSITARSKWDAMCSNWARRASISSSTRPSYDKHWKYNSQNKCAGKSWMTRIEWGSTRGFG